MRKKLSAISIFGLVLSLFTAGPAVTAAAPQPSGGASDSVIRVSSDFSSQAVETQFEVRNADLTAPVGSIEMRLFTAEGNVTSGDAFAEEFITAEYSEDGRFSQTLNDGNYLLEIVPLSENTGSLAFTKFGISVSSGVATVTRTDSTQVTASAGGVFQLPLYEANVVGNLQNPDGSVVVTDYENEIYYEVEVLRYSGNGYHGFGEYVSVRESGNFSLRILDDGEYKLRFSAFGRIDVATTTSDSFVISGGSLVTLADQQLVEPMLVLRVRSATGTEDLPFVSIEIRRGDEYVDRAFTGPSASTAISFETAGTYTLQLEPEWGTTGNARASYQVVVTDTSGTLTASVTGVTPGSDGIYILRFKAPTISGQVLDPTGTNGIAFAQVLPIRDGDSYPLYEYAGFTDGEGNYSIALPEGTFTIYAQAPWDNSTYGDGPQVGPIVVNSSGTATSVPAGYAANDFEIRLANPTWSGKVVSPIDNTTPIQGASVCLYAMMFAVTSSCSNTDENGNFALSAPADFTGFDEGSNLRVEKWDSVEFTGKEYQGESEVESALGVYTLGETYSDITLSLALPNFEITVLAGGQPASRVWVWANSDFGYIGGKETGNDGIARLSLDAEDLSQGIRIGTDIWNNAALSLDFTPTEIFIEPNSLQLVDGFYRATVNLAVPNFTALVKKPSDEGLQIAGNTNIEVQNLETFEYKWINVSRNGIATTNLAAPVSGSAFYQLKVQPPWDSVDPISATTFIVEVDSSGAVVSVTDKNAALVGTENVTISGTAISAYVLALAESNVLGSVVQVNDGVESGVRDSWIETRDRLTQEYLWEKSTNSKFGGNFGVDLDNGDYELVANAPWNSSKVKSEKCNVVVSSGAVSAGLSDSACVDSNGLVQLTLRDGNLQINLKDPAGQPVTYGHIGVSVGNWYTWGQSDRTGLASLFIDIDEIKEQNPSWAAANNTSDDLDIRMWFDPPWGVAGLTRWECSTSDVGLVSGSICDVLEPVDVAAGFAAPSGSVDAAFPAPNTIITVTDGSEDIGVGAWVNIYRTNGNGYQYWVGGGQTDYDGKAYFNLDLTDTTSTYRVEVNPPWNKNNLFSTAKYDIVGAENVGGQSLALKTPNLFLTVTKSDGNGPARWSWVGLEKVDPSDLSFESWENGTGTNQGGKGALSLDANSTYKLTIYPGFASAGARTSCILETDASSNVSLVSGKCSAGTLSGDQLQIQLSRGNLTGTITDATSGSAVAGVTVFAKNASGETIETVSDQNGKYGLQLDHGDWKISYYFAGETEEGFELTNQVESVELFLFDTGQEPAFNFNDGEVRNIQMVRKQ